MGNLHGALLVVDKFSSLKKYSLIYDKIGYCVPSLMEPLYLIDLPKKVQKIVKPIMHKENHDPKKRIVRPALDYAMMETLWWLEDRGFCYEVYKKDFEKPLNVDKKRIEVLESILQILQKEGGYHSQTSYEELLDSIVYSPYSFF